MFRSREAACDRELSIVGSWSSIDSLRPVFDASPELEYPHGSAAVSIP